MNYEERVRAFDRMIAKNPWRLSRSAQSLWYRLNALMDQEGVDGAVEVAGSTLSRLMGATEKTFLAARYELEEEGLIRCARGVKASPSKYRLLEVQ